MAQIRDSVTRAHVLTPDGRVHQRGDGTLAVYASVEEVAALAEGAGLRVQEGKYATVRNVNRRTGEVLSRVRSLSECTVLACVS